MLLQVIFVVALVCLGTALDLPSDFIICKQNDDDLNGCLKKAIQDALPKLADGLPEFHFAPIEPLYVQSLTIEPGEKVVHVVQNYKNLELYDLIWAKILCVDANITDTNLDLKVDAFLPRIKAVGDYDFNGQIVFVPIIGKGKVTIILHDVIVNVSLSGEEYKKKKTNYLDIRDLELSITPKKIIFNFENLFNGNEKLGSDTNAVLNNSWKEIWDDIRVSYEEFYAVVVQNLANLIFKKVPHEKVFPK